MCLLCLAKFIQLDIYTIILLKSVCLSQLANCRSQFLLDRLGRCLKLFVSTESTSCHEFASQFGLANFVYVKNTQNYREYRVARATVYLNEAATSHWSPAEPVKRGVNSVMVGRHQTVTTWTAAGRCVRACVRACVRDVFAIYNNSIWPSLIMIIIKIIILYFIQFTHTDDFPSTGTRLV